MRRAAGVPPIRLGYSFVPFPRWIATDRRHGRLSAEDVDLLLYLFSCARNGALAARAETPRLQLERIVEAIHWPHKEESLKRRLRTMRADGRYLTYRTEGNSRHKHGHTYVFTLFPDDPGPSALRPAVDADQSTQLDPFETPATGGITANTLGTPHAAAPTLVAPKPRPPEAGAHPPVDHPAKPLQQHDPSAFTEGSRPPASDLRDKAKACTKDTVAERASQQQDATDPHQEVAAHETEDRVLRAFEEHRRRESAAPKEPAQRLKAQPFHCTCVPKPEGHWCYACSRPVLREP